MIKSSIRKSILKRRLALSKASIKNLSSKIQQHLIESGVFLEANSIGIYSPIKNEVLTHEIIKKCHLLNKEIMLPKINKNQIDFLQFNQHASLIPNEHGILEVANKNTEIINKIDLLICPGIACDKKGNRIGFGGGFYDRFLSKASYQHAGILCFGFQVIEEIQPDKHDVPMDFIVTEDGFLN